MITTNNPFDAITNRLEAIERLLTKVPETITAPTADIINRVELCKRLSITIPTAIRWEKKGKIPCFRIGSNVRYNYTEVINVMQAKGGVKRHG